MCVNMNVAGVTEEGKEVKWVSLTINWYASTWYLVEISSAELMEE